MRLGGRDIIAMSVLSKILSKENRDGRKKSSAEHKTFLDFLEMAADEIDQLIEENPDWYRELPYRAPMSPEQAREFEIEKRAVWRRVIYDAKRSKLTALRWECTNDAKSSDFCNGFHGKVFLHSEYEQLDKIRMPIGCRCILVPEREPEAD